MTRIKRILFTLAASLGLIVPAAIPAIVSAQDIRNGLCAGADLNASSIGEDADGACDSAEVDEAAGQVDGIIETVINIFSLVVGVIAVIMIIVGGIKYITSGGDAGNVTGAKNTILYAVVGLVIVALAQVIVKFVLSSV